MNTSKQISIIVALVFLSVLATGAYTMWDPTRSNQAKEAQLDRTIERGAFLFSVNCVVCHGNKGEGGAASNRLKVAPALNRPDLQGKDAKTGAVSVQDKMQQFKFVVNTITCGRIGKAMPTWGQSQGGTLNDEQIRQLATMITEGTGWDQVNEFAIHGDEKYHYPGYASDHLKLTHALETSSTTVYLNSVDPVGKGSRLQIADELMSITDVVKSVNVQRAANAQSHDARTPIDGLDGVFLAKALDGSSTQVFLNNTGKLHAGDTLTIGGESMTVTAVNEPSLTVERGVGTTNPAAHDDGSDVLKPPVPPDPPAVTQPACGQNLPAAQASPVAPTTPSTKLTVIGQGTAFDTDKLLGEASQPLTITFDNRDSGITHNIHFFKGPDNTGEDVAASDLEAGLIVQTLQFGPLDPGEYYYQCDAHTGQMSGTLTTVAGGAAVSPAPSTSAPTVAAGGAAAPETPASGAAVPAVTSQP